MIDAWYPLIVSMSDSGILVSPSGRGRWMQGYGHMGPSDPARELKRDTNYPALCNMSTPYTYRLSRGNGSLPATFLERRATSPARIRAARGLYVRVSIGGGMTRKEHVRSRRADRKAPGPFRQ